jgi:hypothetical protein
MARAKFFYDLKKSGATLNGSLELKSVNNAATATVVLTKAR